MWRLAEDTITNREIDELATWLGSYPRLTQGPLVREFEQRWSHWLGVEESVMVSSGTAANMLLMMATERHLGRKPRVGISAVTWATNVTPSILLGHEIVVLDISPHTLGIDSDLAVAAMEAGVIDVLFVTHLLGFDALTDDILAAADKCGVVILEDVCESHGARHGRRKVGTFGIGSSFSFYYGHHMSTIEGGIVSSNDPEFADDARVLREHGLARASAWPAEYEADHPDLDPRFLFVSPGLNFRSSDLNAFLGLGQLGSLDARIAQRNANLNLFLELAPEGVWADFRTAGVSSFALPLIANGEQQARAIQRAVAGLGIENRPIVAGNLIRQPFMSSTEFKSEGTPVADHIHDYGLYVGNGHHVDRGMIEQLVEAIRKELR